MTPYRHNDLEFESLKSFDITERQGQKNQKDHNVTVTTIALSKADHDNNGHSRQQPANTSSLLRFVDEWWIFELVAWIASVASLVAMVAILQVYNGKPTPKWAITVHHRTAQITINTVISLFATIMKSSLMVPVAAAISQLKWNWFYQGRPLTDFQLFDSAKQGPVGALTLLWSLRGRSLVCLGSVIVIVSLAIDPFIQNLIAYPQVSVAVGQSTIARTNLYSQFAPGAITGLKSVAPSMLGAVYTGLFDINNTFDVNPVCPTGNCTWTPYVSLGVCSKCVDATTTISKSCSKYEQPIQNSNGDIISNSSIPYCNYTMLDGGPSISGLGYSGDAALGIFGGDSTPAMNISSGTSFPGMKSPISILNAIAGRWKTTGQGIDQLYDISAAQCALFYCVNRYEASVTKGVLHETVVSSWHNDSASFLQLDSPSSLQSTTVDINLKPPSSYLIGTQPDPEFTVLSFSAQALSFQIPTMWIGNITLEEGGLSTSYTYSNDIVNMMYLQGISSLTSMMGNLAKSMTRNMRNADTTQPAVGTALQDVPHVLVRWQWIALPCALQLLTLIFLVGTMADSARRGAILWKSSSLATFYHPLAHDGRAKLGAAMHPREMEKTAAEMAVKWERTDHGYRLVTT